MQFLAVLCCVAAVVASGAGGPADCGVTFDGSSYRKEVVAANLVLASNLAVDHKANVLYYTNYDAEKGIYESAKVNLNTKEISKIEELAGPCSFAVDQQHNTVYAGCGAFKEIGKPGLHRYDDKVGRFTLIGEETKYIQFVYYKDILYYSPHPSLQLHTFVNGRSAPVKDLASEVDQLVIDKDNDKIFYNDDGLYQQKSGSSELVHYPATNSSMALAVDAAGEAYVCDFKSDAIYRLDKAAAGLTKLLDASWCRGLAFDKENNMIYSDSENNKIVRLLKC
nr:venom polypeptide precursor [Doratifera vulnerans]